MPPAKKAAPTPRPFADLLADARPAERSVPICLRADLVADFEQAERELDAARQSPATSLAGTGAAVLAERIEALQAQMHESTREFRLRALSRPAWKLLMDQHQPRLDADGNIVDEDRLARVNTETFFDALIRVSTVDPVITEKQWADLFDNKLSEAQYDQLSGTAWNLNQTAINVPFSRAVSRYRRATEGE